MTLYRVTGVYNTALLVSILIAAKPKNRFSRYNSQNKRKERDEQMKKTVEGANKATTE